MADRFIEKYTKTRCSVDKCTYYYVHSTTVRQAMLTCPGMVHWCQSHSPYYGKHPNVGATATERPATASPIFGGIDHEYIHATLVPSVCSHKKLLNNICRHNAITVLSVAATTKGGRQALGDSNFNAEMNEPHGDHSPKALYGAHEHIFDYGL